MQQSPQGILLDQPIKGKKQNKTKNQDFIPFAELEEYAPVRLKGVNYVLFIVFAVLVSSIVLTALVIVILRTNLKKQKAKEPPRSPRMFPSQKEKLKERNGKPKSGKRSRVGDTTTHMNSDSPTMYSSTTTLTTPV